ARTSLPGVPAICATMQRRRIGTMSVTSSFVLTERRGHVGLATLNRPEKHNAMNRQLTQELVQAIEDFEADDEIRAIVLTGAGERAFSAGGDMTEVRERLGP